MRSRRLAWLGALLLAGCGGGEDGTRPETPQPELVLMWGFEGRGPGQFEAPYGIDLGPGGEIFVVDAGNARVQVFDGAANFLRQWSVRASAAEQPFPDGIAVDPTGSVYVATTYLPALVRKSDTSGKPGGDWAIFPAAVNWVDVDIAPDGSVYVGSFDGLVRKVDPSGTVLVEWQAMPILGGIDVDATGNIFAVGKVDVDPDPVRTTFEERVRKFDAAGNILAGWGTQGTGAGELQALTDVAVGPHGHVFVVDEVRARIIEFDATGSFVREWGSRGALVDQFDRPWRLVFGSGGDLYVTDRARDRVFKYKVP